MIEIAGALLLLLFMLVGLTAVFFTSLGTLIIFTGILLYAFSTGLVIIDIKVLAAVLVLYLIGEGIELLFTIMGVKKFGATNAAVAGALVGAIAGAVGGSAAAGIGIIAGTFIGIFAGGFLAELLVKRSIGGALKAGTGGVIGRLGAVVVKFVIASVMIFIAASRMISFYS
jgi:hypothetical protein